MKLKELFESGMVKDDDTIAIHLPMIGHMEAIRRGRWFNDQILDLMDRDIDTIMYCLGDWDIHLVAKEEGE